MDSGKFDNALSLFEKEFQEAKAKNDTRNMAKYLKNIGDAYSDKRDLQTSLDKYNEALKLIKTVNDKKLERSIYNSLGVIYADMNAYPEAEDNYVKALNISQELKFPYGIIAGNNNLGNLAYLQGNYPKAIEYFEKSLQEINKSKSKQYELSVLMNLSNIYQATGKFDKAKQNYLLILKSINNQKDKSLYADTLLNLALVEQNLGNYPESIKRYDESLSIYTQLKDKNKIALLNLDKGVTLNKMGKFDEAITSLQIARDIAKELNLVSIGVKADNNIKKFYKELLLYCGTFQETLKSDGSTDEDIKQLPEYFKRTNQEYFSKLAQTMSDMNSYCNSVNKSIKQHFQQGIIDLNKNIINAKELNDKASLIAYYHDLAFDYSYFKKYEDAINALNEAIKIQTQISDPQLWESYYELAQIYQTKGNTDTALTNYQMAVESVLDINQNISNVRDKATYMEEKQQLFKDYAALKAKSGDATEAMIINDLGKVSEQSDILNQQIKNSAQGNLQPKVQLFNEALQSKSKVAELANELTQQALKPINFKHYINAPDLKQQLRDARANFQKISLELQEKYPDLLKFVAVKPSNIKSLQKNLPQDSILIEPILFENKIMIFIAPPGTKPATYKEVDVSQSNLFSNILGFRKTVTQTSEKDKLLSYSSNLYDVLIKPVEEDIKGYKTLVICPYENLRYIPFQALYDGKNYLVEKYAIVNITSSSALNIKEQKHPADHKVLAYANATEDLPASENEVKDIAKTFPASAIFLRNKASKDSFNNEVDKDYNVIHLATHGILNSDEPEKSRLLFSGNQDNALSVSDIMGYDFSNKDLIVLSACNSNIGRAKGAEISSLGAAFEMSSAPTVIASLWKVSDDSTAILMKDFYKNLSTGESKADALQNAQISLIKSEKYNYPYYWAPFVLMGEWK